MKVSELYVYPIKSCRGIGLSEARVNARGIEHDREYMVIDADTGMFVAQRQDNGLGIEIKSMCQVKTKLQPMNFIHIWAPEMRGVHINPKLAGSEMRVQVWKNGGILAYDMGDFLADWFTKFLSRERPGKYRLVRMTDDFIRRAKIGDAQVGFADAYPFMGIGCSALGELNRRLAVKRHPELPMNRFRPNIVFGDAAPHSEDHMKVIKIGDEGGVILDGMTLCERCPLPCTDQEIAVRTKEPSATWAEYRRGRHIGITDPTKQGAVFFGRNFNHRGPGYIKVGDYVEILESD